MYHSEQRPCDLVAGRAIGESIEQDDWGSISSAPFSTADGELPCSPLDEVADIPQSTYLLSTLIQLRTSFPPDPEHSSAPEDSTTEALHSFSSTNLFASLPEYQLFGTLFDAAFLAAAALTIGALWIHGQLNQAEVFT